jgi:hypothetical protein
MSLGLLAVNQLCAQSLERYVIGSTGLSTQNAGLQLSFTVGEAVAGSHQTQNLQLHQGFQQAGLVMITGIEEPGYVPGVIAYPNPVGAILFLEVTTTDAYDLSWEIYDLTGKQTFAAGRLGGTGSIRQQIDVSHLAQGIYFFVITTKAGYPVKTFKIQKYH